jgi:hypothetical protein
MHAALGTNDYSTIITSDCVVLHFWIQNQIGKNRMIPIGNVEIKLIEHE